MKEDISKAVKEEIKKLNNKRYGNFMDGLIAVLMIFSSFTAIVFGVYLLPKVIELSESIKKIDWVLAVGVLGFGVLPFLFLLKETEKKKENKE